MLGRLGWSLARMVGLTLVLMLAPMMLCTIPTLGKDPRRGGRMASSSA